MLTHAETEGLVHEAAAQRANGEEVPDLAAAYAVIYEHGGPDESRYSQTFSRRGEPNMQDPLSRQEYMAKVMQDEHEPLFREPEDWVEEKVDFDPTSAESRQEAMAAILASPEAEEGAGS